jgi:hypothetical protein
MNNLEQINKIKHLIRFKFKNIRRFCAITGIPEKEMRNFFSGKMAMSKTEQYLNILQSKIQDTDLTPDPKHTSDEQREFIRQNIVIKYHSIRGFCRTYEQYHPVMVSNIITGRRKKYDTDVKELMDLLGK